MLLWSVFALMIAVGLAAVLTPLLRRADGEAESHARDVDVYRDQLAEVDRDLERGLVREADADAARAEIARRLLAAGTPPDAPDAARAGASGRRPRAVAALAAAVLVPALAIVLYLQSGNPSLRDQPLAARLAAPVTSGNIPELVARVEAHLRANPRDARGWRVIAPVYMRLQRYGDAADALERVLRIDGRDAKVLADYGEALVLGDAGVVSERARKAFAEARAADPSLAKPRYFLALADLQDGRRDRAVDAWRALLAEAPADAPWRAVVEAQIARASGDTPAAPQLSAEAVEGAREMTPEQRREMIEGMVQRLADRLDADGGEINDWLRLARAQTVLGRDEAATATLTKARAQFADVPEALARIDDFRRTMNGGEQQ